MAWGTPPSVVRPHTGLWGFLISLMQGSHHGAQMALSLQHLGPNLVLHGLSQWPLGVTFSAMWEAHMWALVAWFGCLFSYFSISLYPIWFYPWMKMGYWVGMEYQWVKEEISNYYCFNYINVHSIHFGALIFGVYLFTIILSSCWIDHLFNTLCSLALIKLYYLKFMLPNISILTPAFFWFLLAWSIFSHPFISIYLCL
jgi:hypothetical protein